MIRKYTLGERYKNSITGSFLNTYDIWKNNQMLEVNSLTSKDYADIIDANRTTLQLSDNDYKLESVLKQLVKNNFKKNIITGCSLTEEPTAFSDGSTMVTRYNANKVIPFIVPINTSGTFVGDLTTAVAPKAFYLSEGILLGHDGDFYVNEPDFYSFYSLMSKILLLDFYSSQTKYAFYSTNKRYEDYIEIIKGSPKKYTCTIDRLGQETTVATSSTDITRRTITSFNFDTIEELYAELISAGFNNGTTDISDSKYIKIDSRLIFAKGTNVGPGGNFYNFVVLNEINKKIEVYYEPVNRAVNTIERNNARNSIKTFLDGLYLNKYKLIYSIAVNENGTSSGLQEENTVSFSQTTLLGYTVDDTVARTALVNSGILNVHDRVKQIDTGTLYKFDGVSLIQDM